MEVYERINSILKEKKILKKKFVEKLLSLEPKLKTTDEIPTAPTIYSYLNGTLNLKLELIPYIAEALDITEQELFDNTKKSRLKYINFFLKNPTKEEIELIKSKTLKYDIKIKNSIVANKNNGNIIINTKYDNEFEEITHLLKYAPIPLLEKFKKRLKEFKKISEDF